MWYKMNWFLNAKNNICLNFQIKWCLLFVFPDDDDDDDDDDVDDDDDDEWDD